MGMVRWSWYIPFAIGRRIQTDLVGRFRSDPGIRRARAEPLIQQTTDNRAEPVPQFRESLRRSRSR